MTKKKDATAVRVLTFDFIEKKKKDGLDEYEYFFRVKVRGLSDSFLLSENSTVEDLRKGLEELGEKTRFNQTSKKVLEFALADWKEQQKDRAERIERESIVESLAQYAKQKILVKLDPEKYRKEDLAKIAEIIETKLDSLFDAKLMSALKEAQEKKERA